MGHIPLEIFWETAYQCGNNCPLLHPSLFSAECAILTVSHATIKFVATEKK